MQVPTEAKPFASLSSGLLARKGAARPAMRPQGFGQGGNGLRTSAGTTWASNRPRRPKPPRDEDHDAFGDDVVEHPRVHPTGLTPVGRRSTTSRPRSSSASPRGGEAREDEADEISEAMSAETDETAPSSSRSRRRAPVPVAAAPAASGPLRRRLRAALRAPRSAPGSKARRRLRSASIQIVISS